MANVIKFLERKCIHIGHGNMDEEYKMGDAVLRRTTQEKELGVTFNADMKVSEQCGIVGLSISQWRPCPLAIWNLLFGMAILLNLVKCFCRHTSTSVSRLPLLSAIFFFCHRPFPFYRQHYSSLCSLLLLTGAFFF